MRRFAATSGGVSCLNQTTLPLASRISGPPGPTGESVTVAADPGCTTGEGSGVRKIEPLPPALRTAIFGGCSPGSLLKLCSLSGCVEVMVSVGGVGADRRTVNDQRRMRWRGSVSVTVTPSPSSNGVAGTKLAPRSPEYARSLPGVRAADGRADVDAADDRGARAEDADLRLRRGIRGSGRRRERDHEAIPTPVV